MSLTSSLIWDPLSTLRTSWTMKSTKELERLQPTSGDLVLWFEKSPPRNQTKDQGPHLLHPECLYSSETWCTYRRQENWLNAFHFRCLRSILGVSWRDHVPNSTILHLTGSYDLTTIIRQRRLRWLGHVHRMEDGRLPEDILYGECYNAPRRTGRPKLRYKDVIKRDMAGFHISPQSREALAADRNRWRASLSFGYSLSATSYAEKMEKRRAHRR